MRKNTLVLILSTCILILSAVIFAIGPITNKKIGANWGYQNCALISDQIETSSQDSETLKKMKYLCRRQKAMYDLEYCAFIINIVVGFICADLALLDYMGISRDFEIKTGVISCAFGFIGFVLTLVYVCYSGYIFTKDAAYVGLNINYDNFNFNTINAIEKLYDNGAVSKWNEDTSSYLPEYYNDRGTFAAFIKYKDLGKSLYNYDTDYYKKYEGYIDANGEIYKCREAKYDANCQYIYSEPQTEKTNKELYNRWLTALILACIVVLCNLLLAVFGLFLFANFGSFLD
jgi:hypothetical protein